MNYFRKLPIRIQLSVIALSIVIIMVFLILFSYFKTAKVIEQKNIEYFNEMISQINRTISSNCDVLDRLVQNISYSALVQGYLNETDMEKLFEKNIQINDYIRNLSRMKEGILDIAIFSKNGNSFNINGYIDNISKYKDEIPEEKLFYYTERKTMIYNQDQKRNCFIVGARIYSTENYQSKRIELGTTMIVIDANTLPGYKKEASKQNDTILYMTDRKGKVFFTNDRTIKIGSTVSDNLHLEINGERSVANENGVKYIIQTGTISEIDGKIILKVPQKTLLSGLDDISRQQLWGFLLALILLTVPFLFVINNILHPLKKFMQFMNEIRSGKLKNLKRRISLHGYAEIMIMANDFNNMLDKIDDLTRRLITTNTRLYEAELLKKQSEMEYLRSQVNPHFLYNTLESIKGIAAQEGMDNIFNMTKALGRVFHYSIKGADIVELNEELNMIKSYLYIQKIRFGNRLHVEYDFSQEVLQCKILKMLLQPIVENAIYHGIEPKVGEGHVWIGGEIQSDKLILNIKDDGIGMDSDNLKSLRAELAYKTNNEIYKNNSNYGIGFVNVNNRIRLNYGNEFGIDISSAPEIGTNVMITIPFKEKV